MGDALRQGVLLLVQGVLQSGMFLGYQRGGKTCVFRDDTVIGIREAMEHCGASS